MDDKPVIEGNARVQSAPVSVKLTREQYQKIRRMAKSNALWTVSDALRQAVADFIEENGL